MLILYFEVYVATITCDLGRVPLSLYYIACPLYYNNTEDPIGILGSIRLFYQYLFHAIFMCSSTIILRPDDTCIFISFPDLVFAISMPVGNGISVLIIAVSL